MSRLAVAARRLFLVLLGAALLMWPALMNGRPAVYTDTALYFSEADYLMQAIGAVAPRDSAIPRQDPTRLPDRPGQPNMSADIDGGRSPVWAGFFYMLERVGRIWLVAYAQACAAAVVVYLLYRAAAPAGRRLGYLLIMVGLAAASSLPVFATLMMPDLFAGVGGVSMLLLLAYWDRLSRWKRTVVVALLAFSLTTHGSNPIVAGLVAILGAVALVLGGMRPAQAAMRAAVILLVAATAVAGVRLALQPIQARAGEAIGSPPFLSARVLADGPGRGYLRSACDHGAGFALCPFDREPLSDSDDILWSRRRGRGAFDLADAAGRRRMEREDARFALSAVAAHPVAQAMASLANAARQLVMVGVSDIYGDQDRYTLDGYWRRTSLPGIMPDAGACIGQGRCRPRMAAATDAVTIAVTGVSCLFAVWRMLQPDMRDAWKRKAEDGDRRRLARLVVLAGLVLAINAAVCGVLSGPFPRYQARLAWIAPLVAGLLVARVGARPRMSSRI